MYFTGTKRRASHQKHRYNILLAVGSLFLYVTYLQHVNYLTRRRSESAYIRQLNILQLLSRVGEGDGAPLKLNLYLKPFSKYRNNGHEGYWDHDLDLSRSRDVIDDVIIRSAIGRFLLVANWYQVSISHHF